MPNEDFIKQLIEQTKAYKQVKTDEATIQARKEAAVAEAARKQLTTEKADYLFVDGQYSPHDVTWVNIPQGVVWRVIRTLEEFVAYIEQYGLPKHISFNQNMGEKTNADGKKVANAPGVAYAEWLALYCISHGLQVPVWASHSKTVTGRAVFDKFMFEEYPKLKKKYGNRTHTDTLKDSK